MTDATYKSRRARMSVSYEGDLISDDDKKYIDGKLAEREAAFESFAQKKKCPFFKQLLIDCCPDCAAFKKAHLFVRKVDALGDWRGAGEYYEVYPAQCEKDVFYDCDEE